MRGSAPPASGCRTSLTALPLIGSIRLLAEFKMHVVIANAFPCSQNSSHHLARDNEGTESRHGKSTNCHPQRLSDTVAD